MPLEITAGLVIPDDEIHWTASRSGGPGGQNVNKVATRVTVTFDVAGSRTLDDAQRARIRERLATRIDREGVLRVVSQKHRSQPRNREAALARLAELLAAALAEDAPRVPTRPTAAARARRRTDKERQAALKRVRRAPPERT